MACACTGGGWGISPARHEGLDEGAQLAPEQSGYLPLQAHRLQADGAVIVHHEALEGVNPGEGWEGLGSSQAQRGKGEVTHQTGIAGRRLPIGYSLMRPRIACGA